MGCIFVEGISSDDVPHPAPWSVLFRVEKSFIHAQMPQNLSSVSQGLAVRPQQKEVSKPCLPVCAHLI